MQRSNSLLVEIVHGAVTAPQRALLSGIELRVRPGTVTAIVGPSGSGKSALMGILASHQNGSFQATGSWRVFGQLPNPVRPRELAWLPQRGARANGHANSAARAEAPLDWRACIHAEAKLVLLDEPLQGRIGDIDELAQRLRSYVDAGGAALVVTHNLRLMRLISDEVMLVCAGVVDAHCDAETFFDRSPTPLAKRFVEGGNCWPAPAVPELPGHFRWIIDGKLAGMGQPGLLNDIDDELTSIASADISMLVSLTERPFPSGQLRSYGIESRHLPIVDMGVPALGDAASLMARLQTIMDRGGAVALHCHAGLGRTGMMLAAALVWLGKPAQDAIDAVRAICPLYIQSRSQLQFVHRFAELYGAKSDA